MAFSNKVEIGVGPQCRDFGEDEIVPNSNNISTLLKDLSVLFASDVIVKNKD